MKRHFSHNRLFFMLALMLCSTFAMAGNAFAFTAPSQADMWFELYEIFYDKLVEGPLGAACAGAMLTMGLVGAVRGSLYQFGVCSCAAGVIFSLENIVTTLGMVA